MVLSRAGAGRSGGLRRVGRADALLDHPLALGVRRGDAGRRRGGAFQGLALLASRNPPQLCHGDGLRPRCCQGYELQRAQFLRRGRPEQRRRHPAPDRGAGSGPDLPPGVQCPPRGAVRGVFAAGREVRDCALRTHAGSGFGLWLDADHLEQIPHPAFGHRADAFVFGLGRRDCGRGHRAGFQQPPALDGHQRFGQPVHHQPSVSLGHGARDQNPQYRDPFARE